MRNYLLISCLIILLNISSNGQVTSFKIINKTSSITDNTKIASSAGNVYKTLDIINYNYLELEKVPLEIELKNLIAELYDNSRGNTTPILSSLQIKTKSDRISDLKSQVAIINHKQDSLYFMYVKDLLNYKTTTAFTFGPLRSKAFFDILYGNGGKRFRALGNAGINFGNNTGSVYSEIVNGNLGLLRVSLGSMVSSNNSDSVEIKKKEEAYQRLITYGGNTVLNFEYPLAYIHSNNNQYNFISRAIAKGTADLPAFGTTTEKWAGSAALGIDLYGDASLSNNSLRFFFNCNVNKIYGTDVFRDNLGTDLTNFIFGQCSLGLVFLENFKVSFIVATFSSEASLRNRNIVAGGQVLR